VLTKARLLVSLVPTGLVAFTYDSRFQFPTEQRMYRRSLRNRHLHFIASHDTMKILLIKSIL